MPLKTDCANLEGMQISPTVAPFNLTKNVKPEDQSEPGQRSGSKPFDVRIQIKLARSCRRAVCNITTLGLSTGGFRPKVGEFSA